ncbi:MAG: mechanosensitive ion channel [Verrucomicrobiales bacterium]|nr:mechanosensitive ion channel [Verrucomicrobiales bacterium]
MAQAQNNQSPPPNPLPEFAPGAAKAPDPFAPEPPPPPPEPIEADVEPETLFRLLRRAVNDGDFSAIGPWFHETVRKPEFWYDVSLVIGSILFAWIIAYLLKRSYQAGKLPALQKFTAKFQAREKIYPFRLVLVPTMWIVLAVANMIGWKCPILRTYSLIATLFVFMHLPMKFFKWRLWMRILTTTIFLIAALHILGLLDDVSAFLDERSLELGEVEISILDVVKGFIGFFFFIWVAGLISKFVASRINTVEEMNASMKVLIAKVVRVSLYVLAVLMTLGVMGVNLTALTVFGGALGLGLGFGLQKVVSNLVSGIIILLDKSIEPGDVIEIEGTYGWINSLNLRYASVITRDNKEHLIPNENLITNPVINWSYSSELVRIRAPIGISYDSDIRKAMEIAEACAGETERVVSDPAPRCNLMGFGDSSIDLELRFWISDPTNGVGQVRSLVLLKVWDHFKEADIRFPFPQRVVHLRNADALESKK